MLRLIAGFLAGMCCFSTCNAQDPTVVITAPRFPEEVRRLPASVTVITQDDIARSAARTIPELLSAEAGITMTDFFGNNAAVTSIDMRGFGVTGPQNTLIVLDGRRLNDFDLSGVQWAAIPLAGIERIEIVRGSGAVLYGDNASAGIVNIITREPERNVTAAELFGRTASYKTLESQLYASQGFGSFGVNASIYGYRSDGYRQNNRNEQTNGTLSTRWVHERGAIDLQFGADRQSVRLPGARFVQPSIGLDEYSADRRGAQTPLDWASRDGMRASANLLQRFGDSEFILGMGYRSKEQHSYFDQGGFPTFRNDALDLRSLSPRLRMPFGTAGLRHSVVLGADWHNWRYDSRRADRPENDNRPGNIVTVAQDTAGYYLQDTIEFGRTIATLGWRNERAKYAGDDRADPASPACPFGCAAAPSVSEAQRERAWEIGLRHALTDAYSMFARANRSFRFVNAEEIYENDQFFAPQFQVLRPQHALTYEVGGGWRARGNALRAALFRTNVTDEIHLDPFTTGVGNTNLPPSRRQGFELDGAWQASSSLTLNAAYTHTDAKFLEGTLPGGPFVIGSNLSIAGKTVPLVPRHKASVGASWEPRSHTRLSAAFTAVSSKVLDNDEPNTLDHRIPAYRLLDLKLAHSIGHAKVAFTVNNAFNQKYYTYAVRSAFTADRYAVYPLPERAFGLSAELKI